MKSKLDNQNSYNSLSFMAEALIPLIDNLKETNKPQHKLKFHINRMLEELEKLSVDKYKAFKHADLLEEAKSIAVNMLDAGSSEKQIVSHIAKEYNEDVAQTIKVFILEGAEYEKRPHSFEDIMVITDRAYTIFTVLINNRKANEIRSFITLYEEVLKREADGDNVLEKVGTDYTPIKK